MPKTAKNPDEPPVSDDDQRGPYTILGARARKITSLEELEGYITLPAPVREHLENRIEEFETTNPTEDERENFNEVDFDLPDPVQEYLDTRVTARFSENTLHNRQSAYRHYMVYCLVRDIDFLEPTMIAMENFADHQQNHGYSKGSVQNRVYALSALFQYLVKTGDVDENPVQKGAFDMGIKRSNTYNEIRYIEVKDYEKLVDVIDDTRNLLIVQILWNCGVRSQELVDIRVDDVDRENREITVQTAKQNEYEDRTVYYKPSVERTLTQWLDRGGRDAYLRSNASNYLLVGQSSEQLNPSRPTEIINRYATKAGIQSKVDKGPNAAGEHRNTVTSHSCRHSYAVHRVKNGMPIVFLAKLMGHSDVSQTQTYLRFREDDVRDAEMNYRP